VQGPGVQAGVTDSTLLDVTDILPTMAEFARAPANAAGHLPWDGVSFKNLLVPSAAAAAAVAAKGAATHRGRLLATKQQQERALVMLGPHCWSADAVPELLQNRCGLCMGEHVGACCWLAACCTATGILLSDFELNVRPCWSCLAASLIITCSHLCCP
jgi:hypothetical protein